MAYSQMNTIYWQNIWFNSDVLRGGIYAMSFKG